MLGRSDIPPTRSIGKRIRQLVKPRNPSPHHLACSCQQLQKSKPAIPKQQKKSENRKRSPKYEGNSIYRIYDKNRETIIQASPVTFDEPDLPDSPELSVDNTIHMGDLLSTDSRHDANATVASFAA